ncbi:MAG: sigma 54-interacting transcriptional regulator [Desulfitobacteriaceae bacterium]|nr:sigma 54-interacting transcriptional regulator [Desulfitobacteriaceae bacterium]MDI6913417.1 sigma 54-interacting transcriptional regulator [Desulfitobacteriaceae bacterium]
MTQRTIMVVANRQRTADILLQQLREFIGDDIVLQSRSLQNGLGIISDQTLVVASTPFATANLNEWLPRSTAVVTAVRTMRKDSWENIMKLRMRTSALVVNDGQDTALDSVALLKDLGLAHLNLVPCYPGLAEVPNIAIALTHGEPQLVPRGVKKVIDMGDRVLDPTTLIEVLTLIGRLDQEHYQQVLDYTDQVMLRPGNRQLLQGFVAMRQDLESVLDAIPEGILVVDAKGNFRLANRAWEKIMGKKSWQFVGKTLHQIGDELRLERNLWPAPESGAVTVDLLNRKVMLRAFGRGKNQGIVYTWQRIEERKSSKVAAGVEDYPKQELRVNGFRARYTFKDIVGESKVLRETLERANQFAETSASIVITGESGTGKELFAQAIHNASPRSPLPFVAINCAAIPESLLESELFGYEGGSFTGALRSGREGLFEQAHMGTIFLDEIAELPLSLQSRLLRVLQEKEVMRIGANRVRPIDVRVISASNQDLEQEVMRGKLRPDLYYRLAVLPLYIPPLRERKEDLVLLVQKFLADFHDRRPWSPALLAKLQAYHWPGNVRELRNCVEYLVTTAKDIFQADDLPPTLKRLGDERTARLLEENKESLETTLEPFLLLALSEEHMGRRKLTELAQKAGFQVGEGQMRVALEKLAVRGLVLVRRGRAGVGITQAGLCALQDKAFYGTKMDA